MWTGQCPECKEWNTLEETLLDKKAAKISKVSCDEEPKTLDEISLKENLRFPTGMREFDRVLGGGLVQGSPTPSSCSGPHLWFSLLIKFSTISIVFRILHQNL